MKDTFSFAKKRLERAKGLLEESLSFFEMKNKERMIESVLLYEKETEKIVNHARGILIPFSNQDKSLDDRLVGQIIEETGTYATFYDEDIFYLRLPMLLPRKEKGDASYIRFIAYTALKDFFQEGFSDYYEEKTILLVRHNYPQGASFRDHDNIELNVVIDVLSTFLLTDDSSLFLDHYYCSREDQDEAFTEFFLIPKREFLSFARKEGIF